MRKFLESPTQNTFNIVILSIRKDLYSIRSRLKSENLIIENNIFKA